MFKNIEVLEQDKCVGCKNCSSVCKLGCISFEYKSNGFYYPIVDNNSCVECGACVRACPLLNETYTKRSNEPLAAYGCYAKARELVEKSSSGGIFSLLAKTVLDKNGVVYGLAFGDDFIDIKHIRIDRVDDLYRIRGSKYVQSDMEGVAESIREDLKESRLVLFSGTPCQCAAISFLTHNNLFLIDFTCHGVPSPLVWKAYLNAIKDKKGNIKSVEFRNKDWDWQYSKLKITFDNNKPYWESNENGLFMKYFFDDKNLRESCYNCSFRGLRRISDITLADYWGVVNQIPSFTNERGTSYCTVNTEKGRRLWDMVSPYIVYCDAPLEYIKNAVNPQKTESSYTVGDVLAARDTLAYLKKVTKRPIKERIKLALRIKTNFKRYLRKMRLKG